MGLKLSSWNWRPFCLCLNVLIEHNKILQEHETKTLSKYANDNLHGCQTIALKPNQMNPGVRQLQSATTQRRVRTYALVWNRPGRTNEALSRLYRLSGISIDRYHLTNIGNPNPGNSYIGCVVWRHGDDSTFCIPYYFTRNYVAALYQFVCSMNDKWLLIKPFLSRGLKIIQYYFFCYISVMILTEILQRLWEIMLFLWIFCGWNVPYIMMQFWQLILLPIFLDIDFLFLCMRSRLKLESYIVYFTLISIFASVFQPFLSILQINLFSFWVNFFAKTLFIL